MANLLVVILHEPDKVPPLLEAWQSIGLPGATILNSAGGYRATTWLNRVGLGAIGQIFGIRAVQSKTLLSAIEDDALLEKATAAVETIVGSLNVPGRGLYFVVPITGSEGINTPAEAGEHAPPSPPPPPPFDAKLRNVRVSTVAEILDLTPVIVNEETSLPDVARTMIGDPTVTVACVVNKRRRLVGLLPLQTLADDLFLLVMPEDFLVETRSLEDVLHFAHLSHTKTAGDAMIPPVWVTADTPMKEAFRNMHRHKLLGIPVIDEAHHVVGYINLLEMLELYARQQPPAPPALQGGDDD